MCDPSLCWQVAACLCLACVNIVWCSVRCSIVSSQPETIALKIPHNLACTLIVADTVFGVILQLCTHNSLHGPWLCAWPESKWPSSTEHCVAPAQSWVGLLKHRPGSSKLSQLCSHWRKQSWTLCKSCKWWSWVCRSALLYIHALPVNHIVHAGCVAYKALAASCQPRTSVMSRPACKRYKHVNVSAFKPFLVTNACYVLHSKMQAPTHINRKSVQRTMSTPHAWLTHSLLTSCEVYFHHAVLTVIHKSDSCAMLGTRCKIRYTVFDQMDPSQVHILHVGTFEAVIVLVAGHSRKQHWNHWSRYERATMTKLFRRTKCVGHLWYTPHCHVDWCSCSCMTCGVQLLIHSTMLMACIGLMTGMDAPN